ncbi:hypothetical protein I552_0089 [Mycobacterium xenopi 3993]|nr:hypothetical protein I552_0089 [Mycobacterium xenopi 3993]
MCTTMVPGRTADVAARPATKLASSVSVTASSNSSALFATSGPATPGVGQADLARCRDAWKWRCRPPRHGRRVQRDSQRGAHPPAEMIPTLSRAGRNPSNCTIAERTSHVCWFVPVPRRGYRRSLRLYRRRRGRAVGLVTLRAADAGTGGPAATVPAARRLIAYPTMARRVRAAVPGVGSDGADMVDAACSGDQVAADGTGEAAGRRGR